MAHHQHQHQRNDTRRLSAVQSLLKMFHLSNEPTVLPLSEEDLNGEADEPPDDQLSPLPSFPILHNEDNMYRKSSAPPKLTCRESLLTRAIRASSNPPEYVPTSPVSPLTRGFSATSFHSTASVGSTAELTSDGTSTPPRSATPSPPPPATRYPPLTSDIDGKLSSSKAVTPSVPEVGEAAVEKTLGRKRCIMFACDATAPEPPKAVVPESKEELAEPPKRKRMLTFACPSRADKSTDLASEVLKTGDTRKSSTESAMSAKESIDQATTKPAPADVGPKSSEVTSSGFHEFGSSDQPDAWVDHPIEYKRRLTLDDCLMKENVIRQLGKEAEEEADEEDREEEELNNAVEEEDTSREDDFAPSDDSSDGGNESDDEEGFADSDDESDTGSAYQFWTPSTTTAATSTENINITHFSSRQRSAASSFESSSHVSNRMSHHLSRHPTRGSKRTRGRRHGPRVPKMRPGTPELPDSTDFVCGTLDEDRPLEAAYIACREQRKLEKHIPIPQDIDPSFPTSDPEEDDGDDDDMVNTVDNNDEVQLSDIDGDKCRGRGKSSTVKVSPLHSPGRLRSPPPNFHRPKLEMTRRVSHRSPPPPIYNIARSPPPRRLFGHSPSRLRFPPPNISLRSPRGSPTNRDSPLGITINRLAQRPGMGRTSSLPHTPNPFFRNLQLGNGEISNLASGPLSPRAESETGKPEMHVRGPVDIVIGLEKKRQKRKEKFWRQHCRKYAKEQAERKPIPGRGAERMKELGLECAERNRGYGLGQPAQLVISL
jgi:Protein of unknown function (DUF2457)